MLEFALLPRRKNLPKPVENGRDEGVVSRTSPAELAYCSTSEARSRIPFEQALSLGVLPIGVSESAGQSVLTVITCEPYGAEVSQLLRFLSDCEIIAETAPRALLEPAIISAYRGQQTELRKAARRAQESVPHRLQRAPQSRAMPVVHEAAIPQLLSTIVERAIYLGASDVHIEPFGAGTRLRFRVNGMLRVEPDLSFSPEIAGNLIRRVKVLCRLDTTVQNQPQEGGFSHAYAQGAIRIRVSIIPQLTLEKAVMRLLYNPFLDSVFSAAENPFPSLGLSQEQEQTLRLYLGQDRGVILAVGPTGSGKSTLLYVMLQELNREWRNIISIEDPIERVIPGVNQIEVNEQPGMGYAELLSHLLRQDPNAIMIGEIRDERTASTALGAGITGSFVLSTLHAGNCLEVFSRLEQLRVSPLLIAASLKLIVAQRLLATNCLRCRRETSASTILSRLFSLPSEVTLYTAEGCVSCGQTGTGGRAGVFEFLRITPALRKALSAANSEELSGGASFSQERIERTAREEGYQPFASAVRERLIRGEVSPATALRALGVCPAFAGY